MRICEVCGFKEEEEIRDQEEMQQVDLHVCESCRQDRKYNPLNWIF